MMKILVLNKKGVDELVDEKLSQMPLNQRYERISRNSYNEYLDGSDYRVVVLPLEKSYNHISGQKVRKVDLLGPHEDVPSFLVASNEAEKEKLLDRSATSWDGNQNQLIVLDEGVYIKRFDFYPSIRKMTAHPLESIHFLSGIVQYDHYGQKPQPKIWEHVVEDMVDYFLSTKLCEYGSKKAVFDSERSRDKLMETFDKFGLKPL